ncbi:hypothetical protein M899_0567 [Bacteriovorax sp. BSW11_IV]|uniref:hypothetical protein n=1 Tax=Bacteriovorax sp. BSW11_IV TaxID=1353529 RepID=UPI000389F969|nr:hypothetical protein [Bacteriovorax sp. BSW11_IV]EQC45007.1 hypothetical protein M899_0567 [Bacteriovorax sp. BSW11_IV]
MQQLLTKTIVDNLADKLKCKKKVLSSYLGVTPTTLSMNIEKPFAEVKDNKFGKRLLSLLYVVDAIGKDLSLSPDVMRHILVMPKYRTKEGMFLDVVSAIHYGEFNDEFLVEVAKAALHSLREKFDRDNTPAKNSLYHQALDA